MPEEFRGLRSKPLLNLVPGEGEGHLDRVETVPMAINVRLAETQPNENNNGPVLSDLLGQNEKSQEVCLKCVFLLKISNVFDNCWEPEVSVSIC